MEGRDMVVEQAIFQKLCDHLKRHGKDATMTCVELQGAIGTTEKVLMAALRELRGPNNNQDLQVQFVGGDRDKITLGSSWRGKCEDQQGRIVQ